MKSIVGIRSACRALKVWPSTYYRNRHSSGMVVTKPVRQSPLALSADERRQALALLYSAEFVDDAPAAIFAKLLDRGQYVCSVRTLYRILADHGEIRERRRVRRQGHFQKPELLATAPNQVWSWDITKLKGPQIWAYYYLYVILDIFSRFIVGWLLAYKESAILAERLIRTTVDKQGIAYGQLTIHADRGSSMKSKTVAQLMGELGICKSHNRPHVSNDNPYSEAQFKTLKYSPGFPKRFGSIQDATSHCRRLFQWYNQEHRHSGIAMLTPEDVHYGLAQQILDGRQAVLDKAFAANPARFRYRLPQVARLPEEVWINKPKKEAQEEESPVLVVQ